MCSSAGTPAHPVLDTPALLEQNNGGIFGLVLRERLVARTPVIWAGFMVHHLRRPVMLGEERQILTSRIIAVRGRVECAAVRVGAFDDGHVGVNRYGV